MNIGRRLAGGALLSALALVASGFANAGPAGAIVGGTESNWSDYPYFVTTSGNLGYCAGSAIAANWVLTAAHCMDANNDVNNPQSVIVSTSVGWSRAVAVIDHPLWDGTTGHGHDVALVRLPDGALTGVPPVRVGAPWHPEIYTAGTEATIMGMGQETPDGPPSFRLLAADTPLRSDDYMRDVGFSWIGPLMIGAGSTGQTTCYGDSGSPLVVWPDGRPIQVGVVSFGVQACNRAAAFAELAGPQLAWIASRVPSIMDGWGTCTAADGTIGQAVVTYGSSPLPGTQPDGPYFWGISCWTPPPPMAVVPDVRDKTLDRAGAAIRAAGLVLGQPPQYVVDKNCGHTNTVMRQSPTAGTSVPPGSVVQLTIGQQPSKPCP